MEYLAHSAIERLPPQLYSDHIKGVKELAVNYTGEVSQYTNVGDDLRQIVDQAATWHDLGKLDLDNQRTLWEGGNRRHLPINHVDAGTAYLLSKNAQCAALIVYSHHRGLPNLIDEMERGDSYFRDFEEKVRQHTNQTYQTLADRHLKAMNGQHAVDDRPPNATLPMFYRMCLSCLVDADHHDTDRYYNGTKKSTKIQLKAQERLASLDRYVKQLGNHNSESITRDKVYSECRNAQGTGNFSLCVAPVGSGKTTAVMAHLLRQAAQRGARRIFVVLPYINIIQQSVDIYRKALVLPGENPEEVVAEVHHLVDYDDPLLQKYSTTWKAPIVVTTAVAFFSTLSSNKPSVLRKLHEVPGSVIFLDEAHAMLPLKYIPHAWQSMETLAREWGCYWCLASGSAVRFWEVNQLLHTQEQVVELLGKDVAMQLSEHETCRVAYKWKRTASKREDLESTVLSKPGPRLLILNTVQNAAVIADDLRNRIGRERVEHLSTALTAYDRKRTIQRVRGRLADPNDNDWVLVATSCVEAGMDFSFRTGFREIASLSSLLQTSGRVNRNGEYDGSDVWSFTLAQDRMLNKNPEVEGGASILKRYFENGAQISPDLVTDSIKKEIVQYGINERFIKQLSKEERMCSFVDVAHDMKNIIGGDAVPVLVGADVAEGVKRGRGDRETIQKHSVSVPKYRIDEWGVSQYKTGLYVWTLAYDNFLGYMAGVLPIIKMHCGECFV